MVSDEFIEIRFKVILGFFWCAICAVFTYLSLKNLICKKHNYSYTRPSTSVIIASLLVAILFNLQALTHFSFCALDIINIIDWCSPSAPNHYYADMINSALYHMGRFSYYLYLIFNLENHVKHNEIIRSSVCRGFITFLKFIVVICFIEVTIVIIIKWKTQDSNYVGTTPYRGYHDIFYFASSLFMDISCMSLYIRGLHKYAIYYNTRFRDEYIKNNETEKSHEILIKVTRWVISFGSSLAFDIVTVIINMIYYYRFRHNSSGTELLVAQCVFVFMLTVNDISFVVSVYFSHDFAHRMYECCCKPCDRQMHQHCDQINKKKMEKNINAEKYAKLIVSDPDPPNQ